MSFQDRIKTADDYANSLAEKLRGMGYIIEFTGTEHVAPNLQHELSSDKYTDITSRDIRYQPDAGIANPITGKSHYLEIKHSDAIEKHAYITYMEKHESGKSVMIAIKSRSGKEYWLPINELVLIDGNVTASKYRNPFPVDDDGWIAPRLMDKQRYYKWKQKHPRASGTPFRYIDFDAIRRWLRNE